MPYPELKPHETEYDPTQDVGQLVSNPSRAIPITQEYPTMNLNTDDANSVSRFFQSLADKVVLASTLPKEVEDLRAAVDQLKKDVEAYREHNARMDEEISNLRRERQALQDENARLTVDLNNEAKDHQIAETRWSQACSERDRWHNDYIALSTSHEDMKRVKDDADMRIMELEENLSRVSNERDDAQRERDSVHERLASIRNALAA